MLDKKVCLAVSLPVHPRVDGRGGGQVRFFHTKPIQSYIYRPCFVHWGTVMLETHFMKLQLHSFCADSNGDLKLNFQF